MGVIKGGVVLWIVLIVNFRLIKCNFFLARQHSNYRIYRCATNTSFALSWIENDIEENFGHISSYGPKHENYFGCNITEDYRTRTYFLKKPWSLHSSLDSNFNHIILDERWEELLVTRTTFPKSKSATLEYSKILSDLKEDFTIPLSIRTNEEAHIFLCDGESPPSSNCYWLMLEAFSKNATALRKCSAKSIPTQNHIYPGEPCKTPKIKIEHPRDIPHYLSNTKWSHLLLSKTKNVLKLEYLENRKYTKILEFQDANSVQVKHMIIHSKRVNALWKIHNIDYIYTKEESEEINLGPPLYRHNPIVCISMYISMCDSCTIELSLTNSAKKIFNKEIFYSPHSDWSNIKFISRNVEYFDAMSLLVTTKSSSADRFWAIDKVRQCREEEFRMIGLTEPLACQLMTTSSQDVIRLADRQSVDHSKPKENLYCPEDTIGEFCVKCSLLDFGDCARTTVCYKNKCVCSAGYQGVDCYDDCEKGYYGHQCQKKCGKCSKNYSRGTLCNNVDGRCFPCVEDYSGPNCKIPPVLMFASAPNVIEIGFTDATIEITSFEIQDVGDRPQGLTYFFEYVKSNDRDNNWLKVSGVFDLNHLAVKRKIEDLESDTKYLVRSVIITNGTPQTSNSLKTTTFETLCEMENSHFRVVPTNVSVCISLQNVKTRTACKEMAVTLVNNPNRKYLSRDKDECLEDLQPDQEYQLVIEKGSKKLETKFRTSEGVPTKVQNLSSTPSSTSVYLTWNAPRSLNGKLLHYVVEYQLLAYKGCGVKQQINSSKTERKTTQTSIRIDELSAFASYTFSVFAVNTKYNGNATTTMTSTEPSASIAPEEVTKVYNITPSAKEVNVSFIKPDCTKVLGNLTVDVLATCGSPWCTNRTQNRSIDIKSSANNIVLTNLFSYSNYSLEIRHCRISKMCSSDFREFRTGPSAPGPVRDLLVYTKNKTSISMRWAPPFPPNGVLSEYKISYYLRDKRNNQEFENQLNLSSCKIWPDLHCSTISNLTPKKAYKFKIFARNEDIETLGEKTTITDITEIGKAGAPYDLTANWSEENDLKLEWKHPNETNGNIQHFTIHVVNKKNSSKIEKQKVLNYEEYNLTYYYRINASELSSTTLYAISIFAFNGQVGHSASKETESPPSVPNLKGDLEVKASNDTISIGVQFEQPRGNSDKRGLILLRTRAPSNVEDNLGLQKFGLKNSRIIFNCTVKQQINNILTFTLGDNKPPSDYCQNELENKPLEAGTEYNITIILVNSYQGVSRNRLYSFSYNTTGEALSEGNPGLFGLFSLPIILVLIAVLYLKRDKIMSLRDNIFKDHNSVEALNPRGNQIPLSHRSQRGTVIQPKPKPRTRTKLSQKTETAAVYSKPIKITQLEEYLKESIENDQLEQQHALFPRGQTKPWKEGALPENKSKNRYNNLLAYDHSRVLLDNITGHAHSDYINANYINGFKMSKVYIATQGPKAATLNDFWRMIWQENVRHIGNLANIYEGGKKKLEKYWPDINETLTFGDIVVQHLSQQVYADFEHRVFNVTKEKETRQVEQLHFSSWPDHGVPLYSQSLVPFLQKMLQIPLSPKSPIVVHCSAGVGRTGTILLCDISLRMAARENTVDLLRNLQLLREQRANMVDNIEQYKLAHLVVLECLVGLHTSLPCKEIEESVEKLMENDAMVAQMRYLRDTQWQDQAMKTVGTGEHGMIVDGKNRFENITPESHGRIFLTYCPPTDPTSSYINAVKVDGFRCPSRYIVTQQPLPNTIGDFWRLVDQHTTSESSMIISLNDINVKDTTSCHFWPTKQEPEMTPVDHITLKHVNTQHFDNYDIVNLYLETEVRQEALPVRVMAFRRWASRVNCPRRLEEFLTFWEQVDVAARGAAPVFVTCYDGVKASGLFVALSFIIEKMKLEQLCDVCQAVRTVRHNRSQFVQDLEQFEYLYKAAVLYIKGFGPYANFN